MNLRLGTDFIAGIITGLIIGYWLDRWLDTSPLLMIVFIILGFASGCRTLFKSMNESIPALEDRSFDHGNNRSEDKGDT
ncbi:MAG: AtpZ/AtpI family protein [Alphaproteobacteria bacterium]|nr:AtpZ/AtpI family protein [Alphaproteobacteria bacterium]